MILPVFGHYYSLYGSHSQSKMAFIFQISCILALNFLILIKYFPKCEGKGSFLKSQINSLSTSRTGAVRGLCEQNIILHP